MRLFNRKRNPLPPYDTLVAEHHLENKVTVNTVGCFGFCSQGPFVKIYPEDTLYKMVKIEDVEEIVENGTMTWATEHVVGIAKDAPAEIIEGLRGHTSGYCVPTFVVDAPGGGGKVPVMPNYVISQTPRKVILRNFEGVITTYTEPEHYESRCNCSVCRGADKNVLSGVAGLEQGKALSFEPSDLPRKKRLWGE